MSHSHHAGFWQRAASDYWQEYATMSELLVGISSQMVAQPHNASRDEPSSPRHAKAA